MFLVYTSQIEYLCRISSEDKSKSQSSIKQGRLAMRKTFLRIRHSLKSLQRWSNLRLLHRPPGILSRHHDLTPVRRLTSTSNKVHPTFLQSFNLPGSWRQLSQKIWTHLACDYTHSLPPHCMAIPPWPMGNSEHLSLGLTCHHNYQAHKQKYSSVRMRSQATALF